MSAATAAGRLSRLEAVVLGLLADRPSHGYALRARISPGLPREQQVKDGVLYPLLGRLERRGLLTRAGADEADGARPRVVYACTAEGERAFEAWLRSDAQDEADEVDATIFLDHPFLKLLFGGRLSAEERAAKLDRIERVTRERLASLDRLEELATGPVGPVLLDIGREREQAVLRGVAALRDAVAR